MNANEIAARNAANEIEARRAYRALVAHERAAQSPNGIAARNADRFAAEWRADTTGCIVRPATSPGYTAQEEADFAAMAGALFR